MQGQCLLLLGRPLVMSDGVIQVVVVAFPTLLAVASADVELRFHDPGDLRPPFDALVLIQVLQDAVLLHRKNSTTSLQAFRSLILTHTNAIMIIPLTHTPRSCHHPI